MDGWIGHIAKGPCIKHTGSYHPSGYGRVYHKGARVAAHRVAYCKSKGLELEDISGQIVRHACDNPACVNPDHLSLGDHADNMMDKMHRGRCSSRPGSWVILMVDSQGRSHKFKSQQEAAKATGISQPAISKLVRGKSIRVKAMRGWSLLSATKHQPRI